MNTVFRTTCFRQEIQSLHCVNTFVFTRELFLFILYFMHELLDQINMFFRRFDGQLRIINNRIKKLNSIQLFYFAMNRAPVSIQNGD